MIVPIFQSLEISDSFISEMRYVNFEGDVAVDFFVSMLPVVFPAKSVNPLTETRSVNHIK